MDIKKNPKIDLRKRRSLFLAAGYVVAVSVTLAAFEYKTFYEGPIISDPKPDAVNLNTEDEIDITFRKKEVVKPKPPTKITTPIIDTKPPATTFVEVPDETTIDKPTELTFDPPKEFMPEPTEEVYVDPNETFNVVEEMPHFPGGDNGLMKFLAENTNYPAIARENGIEGIVYVQYVVDQSGTVVEVELARGTDPFLDREALRVVKTLIGYDAGKQRGKPVRVLFTVPIHFKLK